MLVWQDIVKKHPELKAALATRDLHEANFLAPSTSVSVVASSSLSSEDALRANKSRKCARALQLLLEMQAGPFHQSPRLLHEAIWVLRS